MKPFYIQRLNAPKAYPLANTPHLAAYYEARLTGPESRDFISQLGEKHRAGLDALNALLSLDYMGSAEFEFGAVPKALRETFSRRDQYKRFQIKVSGSQWFRVVKPQLLLAWLRRAQRCLVWLFRGMCPPLKHLSKTSSRSGVPGSRR